jgi:hypothetical protein
MTRLHLTLYSIAIASFFLTFFTIREQILLYKKRPGARQWQTLHGEIYTKYQPRDAIIFDPEWLAGYATDMNKFNYIDLLRTEKILQNKSIVPERIWFVSMKNDSISKTALIEKKYKLIQEIEVDPLYISLLKRSDQKIVFNLQDNLNTALVFITHNGDTEVAKRRNNSHVFQSNPSDWNTVKQKQQAFSFKQERLNSIQFHPVKNGTKVIQYEDLPEGDFLKVLVYLADSGRRYDIISSVLFSIYINDSKISEYKIDENNSEQFITVPLNKGHVQRISFHVQPLHHDIHKRHILFNGQITKSN